MVQSTFIENLKQKNAEILASLKILEEENLQLQVKTIHLYILKLKNHILSLDLKNRRIYLNGKKINI